MLHRIARDTVVCYFQGSFTERDTFKNNKLAFAEVLLSSYHTAHRRDVRELLTNRISPATQK
ncbi:hypothetical protein B7P43_G13770 [Cryptotermes secundus]|uniref:Uncharacterized protein n=1 Tax=Cryptotermes secundus TaxID=105785 RepID=A0A2J7RSC1_9NEOP|nr:hypothetical protein B7P43_G13770 [Cryptotermes secundus]